MPVLFRKAALDKRSSPERLDSLMQVTTRKGWIALLAASVVIAAGLLWGIWGRMPDRVHGGGIMLRQGGIFRIESGGAGVIGTIDVEVGQVVAVGEVVASVLQPAVARTISQSESELATLESNRDRSTQLLERNRAAALLSSTAEGESLLATQATLEAQIQFLEGRLDAQNEALRLGLVTEDQRQAVEQNLETARSQLISNRSQIERLEADQANINNQADQTEFALAQEVIQAENQLELLRSGYEGETKVTSPYAGRVISRLMDEGQRVSLGETILFVELIGEEAPLQVLAYVPLQGTRIRPQMTALMSPEGVTWEEYGYMLGEVTTVSQAPVSPEAITRVLRNQTLVTQFTAGGGSYEVVIKLELDPETTSGFKWTSRNGPPIPIGSGTLLQVQIDVDEQPPIALVIPTLRRWLGI